MLCYVPAVELQLCHEMMSFTCIYINCQYDIWNVHETEPIIAHVQHLTQPPLTSDVGLNGWAYTNIQTLRTTHDGTIHSTGTVHSGGRSLVLLFNLWREPVSDKGDSAHDHPPVRGVDKHNGSPSHPRTHGGKPADKGEGKGGKLASHWEIMQRDLSGYWLQRTTQSPFPLAGKG